MASQGRQLDRSSIEAQVFAATRDLLEELGSHHARDAVRGSAQLDRDLGLGSLERVELLVRLGRLSGTALPDRVVAEANTLDEIIAALEENGTAAVPSSSPNTAVAPLTDNSAAQSVKTVGLHSRGASSSDAPFD